jgi:hypothetical protein
VKVEARIFLVVAVFCWAVAIMYGIWTDQSAGGVEPVGVAALILSGGLMAIAGSFFWFVSRRIDPRPEDRPDAEIAEGAGDLGFFSPGSYWPIGIAGAATITGLALVFVHIWLVVIGVVALGFTVGGLLFEYYVGGRHPLG